MSNTHHVLTLELKDNEELIELYEQYHQPGMVWPEVLTSIRESGIENMQIFRLKTLLVMVLQTTEHFCFENKASLDSANSKVQEWEKLMERFQHVEKTDLDNRKWQLMKQLFQLHDH